MITGAQIKNGTVTSADIKNGNLGTVDLSAVTRTALQGQTGPQGPAGATGATGAGSFWGQASVATQTYPNSGDPEHTFVAEGLNPIATDNLLVLTIYCVETG